MFRWILFGGSRVDEDVKDDDENEEAQMQKRQNSNLSLELENQNFETAWLMEMKNTGLS